MKTKATLLKQQQKTQLILKRNRKKMAENNSKERILKIAASINTIKLQKSKTESLEIFCFI